MLVKKMHGCGDDFCVIEYDPELVDYNLFAKTVCNRKTGIGADGLVVLKREPLEMRYYNSDGSRALMGGNGIRCFAKLAYDLGLFKRNKATVITGAGNIDLEVIEGEEFSVRVNMGEPIFNNSVVYASDPIDVFGRLIKVDDLKVKVFSFFLGTVHTIVFVESFEQEILKHAKSLSEHKLYAKKTNVDFVIIKDDKNIEVKSYKKGIGWVMASGTGCSAAVVAARKLGLTRTKVRCKTEIDYLDIEISRGGDVFMTGPAVEVFETNFNYVEEK